MLEFEIELLEIQKPDAPAEVGAGRVIYSTLLRKEASHMTGFFVSDSSL